MVSPGKLSSLTGVVVALWSANAFACPNCARAGDEGRTVYYIATGLMLFVPFLLIGALSYWLVRRAAALDLDTTGNKQTP